MDINLCPRCGEALQLGAEIVEAVDSCVAGYIRYKGDEVSGIITITATTGDIVFEHGAAGAEVADTTVNPNGSTPGTIDLSTEAATFSPLQRLINLSPNWEWIWHAALPSEATEDSGTAKIVNNLADQQCKIAAGFAIKIDTDPAFWHSVAVTASGPSTDPHAFDAGWYHQIDYINAISTFASGTSLLKVIAVNDDRFDPTETELYSFGMTTATAKYLPKENERYPLFNNAKTGGRLVVKILNSAALSVPTLEIFFGSCKCGIGVRKEELWDQKSL